MQQTRRSSQHCHVTDGLYESRCGCGGWQRAALRVKQRLYHALNVHSTQCTDVRPLTNPSNFITSLQTVRGKSNCGRWPYSPASASDTLRWPQVSIAARARDVSRQRILKRDDDWYLCVLIAAKLLLILNKDALWRSLSMSAAHVLCWLYNHTAATNTCSVQYMLPVYRLISHARLI